MKQIALGLVFIFSTAASFAACPGTTPVSQEMKASEAVVVGTVMSARMVPQAWDTLDGTEYLVHVDRKVKGKPSGDIKIFAEHTDNAVFLQSGTQYLFFLTNNNQHWMINQCGNSGPMSEEDQAIKRMVHAAGND
ncbi:MAG: hypothetical protein WA510_19535 [Acidobacteriaceae bacterium]